MSRSKHAVELCALLVDDTYGELTSRIFTILLRRGRLPVQMLSKHTRLSPRYVRHGLAVLIQQNLVYYHYDSDTSTTHYEANSDAAYGLVRSGKIMQLVESRYGSLAKDMVQTIFQLGHAKVSELTASFKSKSKRPHGINGHTAKNGTNGAESHNGQIQSSGHIHAILTQLLQVGLVEPITQQMFRSPTDTYSAIEKEILISDYEGNTKGNKQKDELKIKVRGRLQELRADIPNWNLKTGKKRGLNGELADGINGTGKKRRLSNGAVNGNDDYEDSGETLDPNLTLRINYEKCTVALRNKRLVELASDRIGEVTAQVYSELLRTIEDNVQRCRPDPTIDNVVEPEEGPAVTAMEVAASLSKSIDVGNGIGKIGVDLTDDQASEKTIRPDKSKLGDFEMVNGVASEDEDEITGTNGTSNLAANLPVDSDSDSPADRKGNRLKRPKVTFQDEAPQGETSWDRQNRTANVKNHLQLLAHDPCGFLTRGSNRGQGEYYVDYVKIVAHLQETELDQMILENFGTTGHRLARMMRKLGKMEEKQLPNIAFMSQKDVRTKLAQMQMAGVVDIQEVPRDAGRTTARTIFLWYFDTARVSAILLDSLYKCMSRCFQRLDIEKRRVQDILEALQREDTKGKTPDEALETDPLQRLKDFQCKEESLLTEIGRLDELIGVFRDY